MRYLLAAVLFVLVSCVPQKKYDELEARYFAALQTAERNQEQNDALLQEAAREQNRLQNEITELKEQIRLRASEIADAKANMERLQNDFDALATKSTKELQENAKRSNALRQKLEEAQALLREKEGELKNKIDRVQTLENLLKEQRQQLAKIKSSLKDALKSFEGKGITVTEREGRIYVSMENKLLFQSGKWEVGAEGVRALVEVANVLAQQKEVSILVEGHTDNVPFTPRNEIMDNWDLSVMRATAITKILQGNGLSPQKIVAGGRSEYLPIAPNDSAEGKAKNRRVEIILTPDLAKINQLLNQI